MNAVRFVPKKMSLSIVIGGAVVLAAPFAQAVPESFRTNQGKGFDARTRWTTA